MTTTAADLGLDFENVFRHVEQHRNFVFDLAEVSALGTALAQTDFIDEFFDFSPDTGLDFKISRTVLALQTPGGVVVSEVSTYGSK